ncbi:transcriptional regulator, TraR/DksA family [Anaeromyxobacter dehalogenans 2CP-1]|uniref:Transcriptional regulator, TraR/DksA family n=1 Tax=Anaeromyxobacter dehalogenans (strain ATCC BAA-258 / DSM 21875 / 2CP-1) TaxID=455488 RepID=B8J675_ANAD2|nr:TraR/DksA family transcriptional regulator [Anaeromyxobacter dehalogenans]ACL66970.1 transcriptional regulator, TraR/DksA family [Anaeromyxobacter dehalogenans 2CP-1]
MVRSAAGLTPAQLETLRGKLEAERRRVQRLLATPVEDVPAEGERTEPEEVAQRSTEAAHHLGVAERERALLADIERALAKLDAGTYGVSERTGEPIAYPRLAAVPWTRVAAEDEE